MSTRSARRRAPRPSRHPRLEEMECRFLLAQTFTVVNTLDDANMGSLRWAIGRVDADAGSTAAAPDTIAFAIGTGPQTIAPASALPTLARPVILDGTTQPGFDRANPVPIIEISGAATPPGTSGLTVTGGSSTIEGLVINRFQDSGIILQANGGDVILGNTIGLDAAGTAVAAIQNYGISVDSADNTIGGTSPAARNVVAGGTYAIEVGFRSAIVNAPFTGNLVQGNYLGTDASGGVALGKGGIFVVTSDNTIGGTAPGARNVISNAGGVGVQLGGGISGTVVQGNLVQGNFLGINAAGTAALGANLGDGVDILYGLHNTIGGPASGAGNVIVDGDTGVNIQSNGGADEGNVVQGNRVGTDAAGGAALGSPAAPAVQIYSANGNTIGGTAPGAGNVLSNSARGLTISSGSNNVIQGNFIGTDAAGTIALPNRSGGIALVTPAFAGPNSQTSNNTIGGAAPGARNVISGNFSEGVYLAGSDHNFVQGNFIGVGADGVTPLGNGTSGVTVGQGASNAILGNVIADNTVNGVTIYSVNQAGVSQSTGNSILGNSIYGNGNLGIDLNGDGVTTNTPGGPHVGASTPNDLQNYPIITAVAPAVGGGTAVAGTLNAAPMTTFTVQFFANDAPDPSSFGEGRAYLGQLTDVMTGADGNATFAATLAGTVSPTQFVTATATDPAGNTSEFSQLVAGLALSEAGPATPAAVWQDLTFVITLTNAGPSPVYNPTISDTLPPGVTFVSATGGVTPQNGVVTFPLATLPVGGTVRETVVLRATAQGTYNNPVDVATVISNPDPAAEHATASALVNAQASADLGVVVAGPADPVPFGQDVTYTVHASNNGPSTVADATLTDTLPAGVDFVSATGGVTPVGNVLTFPLGTLRPVNESGGSDSVTVTVRPRSAGTFTDRASIGSVTTDKNSENDSGSADAVVSPAVAPTADLSVTITPAALPAATAGAEVTYTLRVVNAGPSEASGVVLTDTLPAGSFFLGATGEVMPVKGVLTFPIGKLGPSGGTDTETFSVRLLTPGTVTDSARVRSDVTDPNPADDAASVTTLVHPAAMPTADLFLGMNPETLPAAAAGAEVTYTLLFINSGPFEATNVVLTDTLPAGSTLVAASGGVTPVNGVLTFHLGNKPPSSGGEDIVQLIVRLTTAGTVTNSARIRSDTTDPNPADNAASLTTVVRPVVTPTADLSVTGGVPGSATAGEAITYTLKVADAGPSGATGVVLTDTLPAGVTFVSATGGVKPVRGVLTFPLKALSSGGGSDSVKITVIPTAAGTLRDSARVHSAVKDPASGNDAATLVTAVKAAPAADLVVAGITATPGPVVAGGLLTYGITLTDRGPGPASGLVATVQVPAHTTFVALKAGDPRITFRAPPVGGGGGSTLTLRGPGMLAGQVESFTLVVRVAPGTAAGSFLANTATVHGGTPDPRPSNNSAKSSVEVAAAHRPTADLAVVASIAPGPILVGHASTLTFTVTNRGPDPADHATLAVTLPAGLAFVSAPGGVRPVGGVLHLPLGTVTSGAHGTVAIVVRPTVAGTLTARASAEAAPADPSPANNRAAAVVSAEAPTTGDGPRVVGIRLYGFHRQQSYLVLDFNAPLDPARATDPANSLVIDEGTNGTGDGQPVTFTSASYNPATHAVTLVPARHLDVHHRYRLRVTGTGPTGVADAAGHPLDGSGDGRPGSDFVGPFDRSNLAGPASALPTASVALTFALTRKAGIPIG